MIAATARSLTRRDDGIVGFRGPDVNPRCLKLYFDAPGRFTPPTDWRLATGNWRNNYSQLWPLEVVRAPREKEISCDVVCGFPDPHPV